jgi:hypothetical protein
MNYSDMELIKQLDGRVRPTLKQQGIEANARPVGGYHLHDSANFSDGRFLELWAAKHGSVERVVFSRMVLIEDVRRLGGLTVVSDDFCRHAASALATVEVK